MALGTLALLGWLTGGTAAAADCPTPTTTDEIDARLVAADAAFAELDVPRFTEALDEAALMLPCLGQPVAEAFAARYHRVAGVRAFTERQPERAGQAFAAVRALDPSYALPEAVFPATHSIREVFANVDLVAAKSEHVPPPLEGELRFDGRAELDRPRSRATIAQVLDATGAPVATRYLFPADPMPAYAAVPEPVAAGVAPDTGYRLSRPARRAITWGSGAAILGSAALYGLSYGTAADFQVRDPSYDQADLDRIRAKNNALVVGSGALAVAGAAGGVSLVLLGSW